MMNNTKFAQVIGIAAAILIIFLLIDDDKKSKKIKELKKEIDENENLTAEIKKQLRDLIQNNTEIDPKIANELGHIAALLEIKQDGSAVLKLSKIIRNAEAHELDVKKEKSRVLASFICGFSVVLGLCKSLKKKSLEQAA